MSSSSGSWHRNVPVRRKLPNCAQNARRLIACSRSCERSKRKSEASRHASGEVHQQKGLLHKRGRDPSPARRLRTGLDHLLGPSPAHALLRGRLQGPTAEPPPWRPPARGPLRRAAFCNAGAGPPQGQHVASPKDAGHPPHGLARQECGKIQGASLQGLLGRLTGSPPVRVAEAGSARRRQGRGGCQRRLLAGEVQPYHCESVVILAWPRSRRRAGMEAAPPNHRPRLRNTFASTSLEAFSDWPRIWALGQEHRHHPRQKGRPLTSMQGSRPSSPSSSRPRTSPLEVGLKDVDRNSQLAERPKCTSW
mmetsp:Transcript_57328/g.134147  ORF Transcript_57328/g.134147 Transcript_57328/m.134147 type:complete len:307 (+) Transcript_57328:819-1739(+)